MAINPHWSIVSIKQPYEYITTKIIVAIDTKTVCEAGFTGWNTRAGDSLTIQFQYNTPAAGGASNAECVANLMHTVFCSDHVLEIRDTGVRAFDECMS